MNFLPEFLLALFIALVLTFVFAAGFRRKNWKASALFYFVILFLATWAGGLWAAPKGPDFSGVFWIPFVVIGLAFGILLAVLAPPGSDAVPDDEGRGRSGRYRPIFLADTLFWVLIVFLAIAIVAGYVQRLM